MLISMIVAAAATGFQVNQADSAPWQTVVSKEGQFVVDFPSAPTSDESRNMKGPSGNIKVIVVECETPSVIYIAEKVVLPTAVIKGAEQLQLNLYRDYFAARFKGKVISEKKVRFEAKAPGLDYTIRAQAQRSVIVTIRVREYLLGQAIYALLAVSAANRELPDDVGRFFGSFTIGTTRIKKSGPKPEAEGKQLAGWGKVIDPDGDCNIAAEGNALVVTVPGVLHDLNADIDKYNAPRILREVDGNFAVQVKVIGDFNPGAKSTNPKSVPFNGGGIFVWRDSDNFIRLERGAILRQGKIGTFSIFEEREGGSRGAAHNGQLTPGTAYLRMERRGSRIFGLTSKDGKHWTQLKPIDTVWPGTLKVGLDAINSSNEPFTVRFEEFSFKGATPSAERDSSSGR